MNPPEGGLVLLKSMLSCSRRSSSFSWSRMYGRTICSSRPTVETRYPRARKFYPVKFRLVSIRLRAMDIALLPLIYPTTDDTAYFGGMLMHM